MKPIDFATINDSGIAAITAAKQSNAALEQLVRDRAIAAEAIRRANQSLENYKVMRIAALEAISATQQAAGAIIFDHEDEPMPAPIPAIETEPAGNDPPPVAEAALELGARTRARKAA